MHFVIHNSVVLSKILKIVMPLKQNFQKINFYSIKLIILIIIDIGKQGSSTTVFNILDNTTELWMTKYIIGEFFSSGGATLYKNPSDQTVFNQQIQFIFQTLQPSNPRILRKIVQDVEVLFSVLRLSLAKGKNFTKNVQLVLLAKIN